MSLNPVKVSFVLVGSTTSQYFCFASEELRDGLREIQAAVRQFLTSTGRPRSRRDFDAFHEALRLLRTRVGTAAGTIAETFDIPVNGDLALIVRAGHGDHHGNNHGNS
ncbi:hypothetical protein [Streptomyces sp. NPDC001508]|uniref:hypothetical protein n=1 Tax=Streptomyces sp. NPDC001508 TaxID=3154656 RepID=UPI00331A4F2D